MSVLGEVLRYVLHGLIFLLWISGFVVFAVAARISFRRAEEYLRRRGSIFAGRTPPPSAFSNEYYLSYRRQMRLMRAFFAVIAAGGLLSWLDTIVVSASN